ncbi:MAG: hypothetical protein EAZ20_01745 [Bacteroidetes bacterium]|nr:MAG: hypothetical protein EAZ20_01745 [Bacteroidota bacterium]
MNTLKKIFNPTFLQKIDRHLLENYPIIWETKIHFILFYSLIIANFILLGISFLLPISKNEVMDYSYFQHVYHFWLTVWFLLGLSFCIYQYKISHIKESYTIKENFLRYFCYVLIVCCLNINYFVLPFLVTLKVQNIFDMEEVKKDIFHLNKLKILSDYLQVVYLSPDHNHYFEKVKKSHLNQNNEANEMINILYAKKMSFFIDEYEKKQLHKKVSLYPKIVNKYPKILISKEHHNLSKNIYRFDEDEIKIINLYFLYNLNNVINVHYNDEIYFYFQQLENKELVQKIEEIAVSKEKLDFYTSLVLDENKIKEFLLINQIDAIAMASEREIHPLQKKYLIFSMFFLY